MLITLSGLDRAGTRNLAEWLRQELARSRRRAVVVRLTDQVGVYAALRAVRRLLGGGPPARDRVRGPLGRMRDAVLWSRPLRRAVYLLDVLIFLAWRGVLEQLGGRVVIMDRYFYDVLVDVAGGRREWSRLLSRMTPRPDLPVLLETPETTDDGYRRVFRAVDAPLLLYAGEPEAARRLLARAVHNHLARGPHHV
jgi:thymidylate kinase